jgi:hypothetical protein
MSHVFKIINSRNLILQYHLKGMMGSIILLINKLNNLIINMDLKYKIYLKNIKSRIKYKKWLC